MRPEGWSNSFIEPRLIIEECTLFQIYFWLVEKNGRIACFSQSSQGSVPKITSTSLLARYLSSWKCEILFKCIIVMISSQKLSLSGANFYHGYKPQITSYDYDAPISESGELTKKYFAMREVILKHRGLPPLPVPVSIPKQSYGNIYMTKVNT